MKSYEVVQGRQTVAKGTPSLEGRRSPLPERAATAALSPISACGRQFLMEAEQLLATGGNEARRELTRVLVRFNRLLARAI